MIFLAAVTETRPGFDYAALAGIFLILLFLAGVVATLWQRRYAPVKTVKAKVVNKSHYESFSKYSGKTVRYAIVFEINGKRKIFDVSAFSYGGYRIGEQGTLKYKGRRIVDFSK